MIGKEINQLGGCLIQSKGLVEHQSERTIQIKTYLETLHRLLNNLIESVQDIRFISEKIATGIFVAKGRELLF